MGLREGQTVLDVGSGLGGPAREIARFAGVDVVGLNNNDYQIRRANRYTTMHGLQDNVSFVKGDFMQMPFEAETFDAVYSIEATFYAPDLAAVYSEAYRVLKPGGVFAVYEVVLTDGYENDNPEHREIRLRIEHGLGASNLVTASVAIEAMKAAGFKLEAAEDLGDRANTKDAIPWYHLIAGSVKHVACLRDFLTAVRIRLSSRSILARGILHYLVVASEKIGLLPPGTHHVIKTLAQGGFSMAKGGEQKLFTPMFLMVAKKPLA
jgi:sterol 24-C-methyltransferase